MDDGTVLCDTDLEYESLKYWSNMQLRFLFAWSVLFCEGCSRDRCFADFIAI